MFKELVNKKAYYDYFVEETLECGISLRGTEVKSIRDGSCSIKEAFVFVQDYQLVIHGMHIKAYDKSNAFDVNENRDRVLLAHKSEVYDWYTKVNKEGYTLMPLKVYFKDNKVKVLVGLCKGKKLYDKRQSLKEKQIKRDIRCSR